VEDRPQYRWANGGEVSRSHTIVVHHMVEAEAEEMDIEELLAGGLPVYLSEVFTRA